MEDIMRIVKSLEESGVSIKKIIRTGTGVIRAGQNL